MQTRENDAHLNTDPTQSGATVSQGLGGVRQTARARKQERFTALLHHLTIDLLRESYFALKRRAAPGVDGVSWQQYESGLEERLIDLHSRVHREAYRAQPSRRVYIPKADGRAMTVGHRVTGRQDRPARDSDHPQPDIRGGLSRLLVRVSTGLQSTSRRWTRSMWASNESE